MGGATRHSEVGANYAYADYPAALEPYDEVLNRA